MRSEQWKEIERRVAEELAHILGAEFKRLPIVGRAEPDVVCKDLGLYIEVKHRVRNPRAYRAPRFGTVEYQNLYGCALRHCASIGSNIIRVSNPMRIILCVDRWMDHLAEGLPPDAIPILVLHYPFQPVLNSNFLLYKQDLERFRERIKTRN